MIEKVKMLMNVYNLQQKELAKKTGLSEVMISRYINGKRKPSIDFAIRIKNAFGVSLDWLLCQEN